VFFVDQNLFLYCLRRTIDHSHLRRLKRYFVASLLAGFSVGLVFVVRIVNRGRES